jgi:hypothetical protein
MTTLIDAVAKLASTDMSEQIKGSYLELTKSPNNGLERDATKVPRLQWSVPALRMRPVRL